MSSPSKEAIIFILDTSETMDKTYPSSKSMPSSSDGCASNVNEHGDKIGQTRLSAAKEALEGLIADLIVKSKTNEVGVILLHTNQTKHHLCFDQSDDEDGDGDGDGDGDNDSSSSSRSDLLDNVKLQQNKKNDDDNDEVPFKHITELSEVQRPSVELLQEIRAIKSSRLPTHRKGGFAAGIILAADAMYNRTQGRRYNRKIILLTDAEREVNINFQQIDLAVNGLRSLDCEITVIGLDFTRMVEYDGPAELDYDVDIDECDKNNDKTHNPNHACEQNTSICSADIDASITNGTGEDSKILKQKLKVDEIKAENEKFLISLTKYTGGRVHSAKSVQQILKQSVGKRITTSTLLKTEFLIAPNFSVPVRVSLSTSKANIPALKRESVMIDEEKKQVMKNSLGEEMTTPIISSTSHWDKDDPDTEVDLLQRASAYQYGSDLITIGQLDMEGLKLRSPPQITILGYTSIDSIPMYSWMGPTRIISGDQSSRRACLAVSSLAQAMKSLDRIAICTYVPRKDSDSMMGILAPLVEEEVNGTSKTNYLVLVRIPFADDVQNISMHPIDDAIGNEEAVTACDDLIEKFMLPSEVLRSDTIPNPAIRSFRKTIINRAIDPSMKEKIIITRKSHDDDDDGVHSAIMTPTKILKDGKDVLKKYRQTFPMEVNEDDNKKGKSKKKFWSDI